MSTKTLRASQKLLPLALALVLGTAILPSVHQSMGFIEQCQQHNRVKSSVTSTTTTTAMSNYVPDTTGESATLAFQKLKAAGFQPQARTQSDSSVPVGCVLLQWPGAGARLAPGSPVVVTVHQDDTRVLIPSLKGLTPELAAHQLRQVGLCPVIRKTPVYADQAMGSVAVVRPSAGSRMHPGAEVVLTLSNGPTPARIVPDLTNLTLDQANTECAPLGIVLQVGDSTAPGGYFVVKSQSLPAGSALPAGTPTKPTLMQVSAAPPDTTTGAADTVQ